MNSNMNMHGPPPHGMAQSQMGVPGGVGVMIQQSSPQQPQQGQVVPNQAQQQQQQQQAEKIDNISKVKSLFPLMKESLHSALRTGAFSLQQNNLADTLKREAVVSNSARFDKNLEDFYAYCDQMELHLRTAMQCMQQLSSAQHYLPGHVNVTRMETYMQENPAAPIPYPTYINTTRVHIQSAKDIHDTLISAAQNISQAD